MQVHRGEKTRFFFLFETKNRRRMGGKEALFSYIKILKQHNSEP
jgi:hypothetical protein